MNKEQKRNDYFHKAKDCAKLEQWPMAHIWLDRAERTCPLTVMQGWSFKMIAGREKFNEIAPKRLLEYDFLDNA